MGGRPESCCALEPPFWRVRVFLHFVFGQSLRFRCWGHIVDGNCWDLGCGILGYSSRGGRSQRISSSGPSDRNRGSGDILRFVACLLVVLVGSRRVPAQFSCYVCCGRFLVASVAPYRGDASLRLIPDGTEASTARATGGPTSENSSKANFYEKALFVKSRRGG